MRVGTVARDNNDARRDIDSEDVHSTVKTVSHGGTCRAWDKTDRVMLCASQQAVWASRVVCVGCCHQVVSSRNCDDLW